MNYHLKSKIETKAEEFIISSIERSYKTHGIIINDEMITVKFEDEVKEEDFKKLMDELLYISKSINHDTLFENNIEHLYKENPMQYLESNKDIIKIARGMYLYQGTFWKTFKLFQKYFKDLAEKYKAVEQEYPPLWPVELFRKINYFKDFPQQVILATTIKDTFKSKSRFAQSYDNKNEYDSVQINDDIGKSHFGLSPAVCDICYYVSREMDNFKNTIYTTYNKVFRNEYSKTDSLDRLLTFSVRDIMFVGDKSFVLLTRQRLIDDLIEFLELFGINSKIETANDPFFSNDSSMKNIFQYTSRLKYEILAKLNYSESYIAIGSINLHLDFFGKTFNIRMPNNEYVYSGCIGIGFERLVYAIYCQYGHDINRWPKEIKDRLHLS